jgi:general L-amino acid transport system substrate-binding protein
MRYFPKISQLSTALCAFMVLFVGASCTDNQSSTRLAQIRDRGFLTCGIWPDTKGFASADAHGNYNGLDVDVCHAVAAAILGDPGAVTYVLAENVQQLRTDETLDIVARRITWSLTRATSNGLMFGPTIFYDGQGFLVPSNLNIESANQLTGASICVQADEGHASTLAAFAHKNGLSVVSVPVENNDDVRNSFESGRCTAYSADVSLLGAARLELKESLGEFDILPELISKEPLAPLVRMGDDQFFEVVRWTIYALIAAEELGITSKNIDSALESRAPETRRLLGAIPGNGAALGLSEDWAYKAIKSVGNYSEMFDRNVGRNSAIGLERGLNKLWTDGGLMYAPRLR